MTRVNAISTQEATPMTGASNVPEPAPRSGRFEVVLQPTATHQAWPDTVVPAIAWPLAVIVLLMRNSIAGALSGIVSRITKFSLAGIGVEMEVTAKASSTEAIDEIRDIAQDAAFPESSRQLKASLADQTPADYAVVNLGTGEQWLTSRLYLLASFAARMRSIRLVVFVGTKATQSLYLGAVASDRLQWALASRFPWLEIAFCNAYQQISVATPVQTMERGDPPVGADGRLSDSGFSQFVQSFRQALQVRDGSPPARLGSNAPAVGWTRIGSAVWERGSWVTENLLVDLLGLDFRKPAVTRTLATSDEEVVKAVLRSDSDLVPVVDDQGVLRGVIRRRDVINRIARRLAEDR